MQLAVAPPIEPMLAKRADALPEGDGWIFEPKWDGFRTLVFRDGAEVMLQSRDKKPMNRYFPELEAPLLAQLPDKCVLDGEVVLVTEDGLDFEALQQRIHPAASRVKMLAEKTPVSFVAFDLLCCGDEDMTAVRFAERRKRLEALLGDTRAPIHLTPATRDVAVAGDWFQRFEGAGLDGVMAKRVDTLYEPGKRVMMKVKHERTCECAVAGFRWHKNGPGTMVGSLLLGLFDAAGVLNHVGVSASFTEKKRKELVPFLAPYRENALDGHPWAGWAGEDDEAYRRPGAQSRWNRGKSLSWEPLRVELVVEVAYDHMQGTRFRHTAQFRRWRSDKQPRDCTFEQLEVVAPYELRAIFATKARAGSD
jgi:ATP-dependent DNA ligase